jgi:hypothetical protein
VKDKRSEHILVRALGWAAFNERKRSKARKLEAVLTSISRPWLTTLNVPSCPTCLTLLRPSRCLPLETDVAPHPRLSIGRR